MILSCNHHSSPAVNETFYHEKHFQMFNSQPATIPSMSDEQTELFESTIVSYRQSLARIVATYEMRPALQQELHQEILLAIWKALPGFRGDSGLHTFIYRVAHNQAMNHISRDSKIPPHESLDEPLESKSGCPEILAMNNQKMTNMFKAMHELPVIQRQILTLALEGLSYQEIAQVTGLNVNNVGVRLNRSKKALKDLLDLNIQEQDNV
ncbi:MAG: RNA polymerase sigma factor (sigma-70 family) [Enterobacterales bacterium]|jgi:RNA polymerase sigma factor (sigma-70 family)